jgi:hypothetical protein
MPKREKTPPPGDDESKYLSIYYPYPPHSTLDEEKNVKECARWLACFVGKENLYTLFHKPSSPNVIIVEINPELTNQKMRGILGLHEWSEVFLKAPDDEITSSKIFYSTFGSRREVEKTGWKPVEVKDEHFKNFNPANREKVEYPYPSTYFCEPPLLTGEVSALKLFRYLPADVFPEARAKSQAPVPAPPAAPVRVVPGSAAAASGGDSTGGKGKKGKGKGKGSASNPDPTVRPTAPLTRSVESSAKAKAIHRQPAPVIAAMYAEDSDDDAGNYMPAHPGTKPANWDGEFNDGSKKEGGLPEEKAEVPKEPPTQAQLIAPFAGIKIKEDDGPLCPHHNKRCKSGICEWAKEQKRIQKRIANKYKDNLTIGQNQRQW